MCYYTILRLVRYKKIRKFYIEVTARSKKELIDKVLSLYTVSDRLRSTTGFYNMLMMKERNKPGHFDQVWMLCFGDEVTENDRIERIAI